MLYWQRTDKVKGEDKCGVVYHIPCLSCPQVYIGETGRKLSVRIGEHEKETDKVTAPRKTRSTSVSEDTTKFKSAVSVHCREMNHIMNFKDVSIIDRESIWSRRRMKEALHVRKLSPEVPMNQDDGGYELSHIWDPLLRKAPATSGRLGAPATSAPDANQVGWGDTGGDMPLFHLVASAHTTGTCKVLQVVCYSSNHIIP